jgi:hypothetical protein
MDCWHCKTELIWNSDVDTEDNSFYSMITFLDCPKCGSETEVWLPRETKNTDDTDQDNA